MACCTTISPVNSGRKRTSGGLFDLPQSSKRRRAPTTTLISSSPSSSSLADIFQTTSTPSSSSSLFTQNLASSSLSQTSKSYLSNQNSFIIDANEAKTSVFQLSSNNNNNTNLSTQRLKDHMMERICSEAKRLIKRRQMSMATITTMNSNENIDINNVTHTNLITKSNSSTNCDNNSLKTPLTTITITTTTTPSSDSLASQHKVISSKQPIPSATTTTPPFRSFHNEIPLFSMNQVNNFCERMVREREQTVRAEYDKILAQKLNEQYDTFVKFTHDQIQRRLENSQCTYVS
jgi:hypothetical protein